MKKIAIAACGLALVLTACGGGSSSSSATSAPEAAASSVSGAMAGAASAAGHAASAAGKTAASGVNAMKNVASASDGAKVFSTNCSSCHGASGQGSPGAFPPLAMNPVVTGDTTKVIHVVKYGLTGKITVAGKEYNGQMPAWSSQLKDSDIAAVVTYIRSSWGNKGSAVSAAQVTAVTK